MILEKIDQDLLALAKQSDNDLKDNLCPSR